MARRSQMLSRALLCMMLLAGCLPSPALGLSGSSRRIFQDKGATENSSGSTYVNTQVVNSTTGDTTTGDVGTQAVQGAGNTGVTNTGDLNSVTNNAVLMDDNGNHPDTDGTGAIDASGGGNSMYIGGGSTSQNTNTDITIGAIGGAQSPVNQTTTIVQQNTTNTDIELGVGTGSPSPSPSAGQPTPADPNAIPAGNNGAIKQGGNSTHSTAQAVNTTGGTTNAHDVGTVANAGNGNTGVTNTGSFNAPTNNAVSMDDNGQHNDNDGTGVADSSSGNPNGMLLAGGNPSQVVASGANSAVSGGASTSLNSGVVGVAGGDAGAVGAAAGAAEASSSDCTGSTCILTNGTVNAGGNPSLSVNAEGNKVKVKDSFNSETTNIHNTTVYNTTSFDTNTGNGQGNQVAQDNGQVQVVNQYTSSEPPVTINVVNNYNNHTIATPLLTGDLTSLVCLELPVQMSAEMQAALLKLSQLAKASRQ